MKNKNTYEYLKSNGWDDEFAISYQYNSHGFRTNEFNSDPVYIALGCSYTEGIGLPNDDVWPNLLSQHIGSKFYNLGVYGASLDTCFRLLDYYVQHLNIQGVFLLEPDESRVEIHRETYVSSLTAGNLSDAMEQNFMKLWVLDQRNSIVNRKKNILAMTHICKDRGIPFINRSAGSVPLTKILARDLIHPGKKQHTDLAVLFLNDFKKIKYGNS